MDDHPGIKFVSTKWEKRDNEDSTLRRYEHPIELLTEWLKVRKMENQPLDVLTDEHIEVFLEEGKLRHKWSGRTYNNHKGFLQTIFKFLVVEMGVDIVELDLKQSKDKEIIILHDQTLNRLTTGKGKPGDFTLSELKQFRLRDGLGVATGNQIPTLREVMLALKGKPVKVNLDYAFPYFRDAYGILQETGTLDHSIFKASVPFDTLRVHYGDLIGKIIYMPVLDLGDSGVTDVIRQYIGSMTCYAFELVFEKDTARVLSDNSFIRSSGAKIWINSLWPNLNGGHYDDLAVEGGNTKDSWDWLIAHGATIIQTDRPRELLAYLRSRHLHR